MRYLILLLLAVAGYSADNRKPLVLSPTNQPTNMTAGDTLYIAPQSGLDAAKPSAATYPKAIYVATDTQKIYRSDGATWTLVGYGVLSVGGDLDGTLPNPVVVQSSNVGGFSVTDTTASTSILTGALRVAGGAGFAKEIFVGGAKSVIVGGDVNGWAFQAANAGGTIGTLQGVRGGVAALGTLGAANLSIAPDGGEVLVGTATDAGAYRLQVSGDTLSGAISIPSAITVAGASKASVDFSGGVGRLIAWGPDLSTAASLDLLTVSSTSGVFNQGLRINPTGETLLGTTTDAGAYRLQVNGATYADGVVVTDVSGYGSVSLNGTTVLANSVGIYGGGAADDNLYLNAPTGSTVQGRINNVQKLSISASDVTASVPVIVPAATTSNTSVRLPHGTAPSSPTNGDMWTTSAGLFVRVNGATVGPLLASAGGVANISNLFSSSTSVSASNTVAETSIVGSGLGSATVTANTLVAGSVLRVKFGGGISATGTPTLNIKLKVGASTVFQTSAVTFPATTTGSNPFFGEADIHVQGTGATAATAGGMTFTVKSTNQVYGTTTILSTIANTSATIDTTAANLVDVTFTWGTADVNNSINETYITLDQVR